MLRKLLKVIAYLSIITSTYASHLSKDTYTRFRRPLAYTDSISADHQQQQKQQSLATSGEERGGGNSGGGSGSNGGDSSSSSSSSGGSESYSYQLYNPKPPLMKYEPILNELNSKTLHRMSDKLIGNNQNNYNKLTQQTNNNSTTNTTTITITTKLNSRNNNNKIKNNYNNNDSNRLKTTNSNYYPQQQQQQHPEVTQDGRELEQIFGTAYAKYAMAKIHQMPTTTSSLNQDQDVMELKKKRGGGGNGGTEEMPEVNDAMVSQMLPRATRRQREYDVPLIRK